MNVIIATYTFGAHKVDVYGCWWEEQNLEYGYDFYDLQLRGPDCCLNLGEPLYDKPTRATVKMYLDEHLEVEGLT